MAAAADVLDMIERMRAEGRDFCVATVVRTVDLTSAKAGAKAVITPGGEITGFVGGGCVTGVVKKAALEAIRAGRPEMIRIRPKEKAQSGTDSDGVPLYKSSCPSGGTVEVFLEPMRAARRIVVCGATPVARALVSVAKSAGFQVVHAAPDEDKNTLAADVFISDYDLSGLNLAADEYVIIATQGQGDRKAAAGALATSARYVAMIGSCRKIDVIRAALSSKDGVPPERAGQLSGPAGLDIGAVGPEEIALSVMAEIVARMRRPDEFGAAAPGHTGA